MSQLNTVYVLKTPAEETLLEYGIRKRKERKEGAESKLAEQIKSAKWSIDTALDDDVDFKKELDAKVIAAFLTGGSMIQLTQNTKNPHVYRVEYLEPAKVQEDERFA